MCWVIVITMIVLKDNIEKRNMYMLGISGCKNLLGGGGQIKYILFQIQQKEVSKHSSLNLFD